MAPNGEEEVGGEREEREMKGGKFGGWRSERESRACVVVVELPGLSTEGQRCFLFVSLCCFSPFKISNSPPKAAGILQNDQRSRSTL